MNSLKGLFYFGIYVSIVLSFAVPGCKRERQAREVLPSSGTTEVLAKTTLLATISDQERPVGSQGLSSHTVSSSEQVVPQEFAVVFSKLGSGVAYSAQKDGKAYVVHNGKPGRMSDGINAIALSPDGRRIAYGVLNKDKWSMVIDGKESKIFDGVGEPVFSPDGRHVAYEVRLGEKWHIVVDDKMNAGCLSYYDKPLFSGDSTKILAIENTMDLGVLRLVVSDLAFNIEAARDVRGNVILTNSDNTRIAAIDSKVKKRVIDFSFNRLDDVKEGPPYDDIRFVVFGVDRSSVSYAAALKGGLRFLILNNKAERLPDDVLIGFPVVRPDQKGAGIFMASSKGIYLHQAFFHDGTKEKHYAEAGDLVYNGDGRLHAYSARQGNNWFVVVNGKEGPPFDRVIMPAFSPDGRFLVYRARKDGKRFVVVADERGKTIRQHAKYERVFEPVFTSDGNSVAYGVKDGNKLIWKVEKLDK